MDVVWVKKEDGEDMVRWKRMTFISNHRSGDGCKKKGEEYFSVNNICACWWLPVWKAGGGDIHSGRSERDAGRAADGGAWGGGDGTHQHGPHQRAAAPAAFLPGREVLPSTAERHLRAGEQVSFESGKLI